jgi:uncharacterized protein YlxP (DUF503 family)
MKGPVDFIIVGFEGNNFNGGILRELQESVEKGVINVLALALVAKDSEGVVTRLDAEDNFSQLELGFLSSAVANQQLVNEDDLDEVGELLDNNSAAGIMIIEHLWAKGLKKAIIDAGGYLVAEGRLRGEVVNELEGEE